MIYTITFNPAVDLVMTLDELKAGDLNRSLSDDYVAGGKGINASVIFKRLGHDNIATGFSGGFTGRFIKDELKKEGIDSHFIQVEGTTRVNVKIHATADETEINAAGPTVTQANFQDLIEYLTQVLTPGDYVFLAGNAAPGMDASHYQAVAKLCQEKEVNFVLDSNKDLLTTCLKYKPFVIKPNHHELGEIYQVELKETEDIIHYAKKLQEEGAKNVIVSRGGEGALLLTEDGDVYESGVPKGKVINSVGAGDSMLSGFIAKFIESGDYGQSLLQGAASGSATAFSVGIAEPELIDQLVKEIQVRKI